MDARDVIVSPRITEKSMADALLHQYTFVVHPQATKTQIRHADRRDISRQRPAREHRERAG